MLWLALAFCAGAARVPPTISPRGGLVHSPALVVLTNVNPIGAIFYTLDGTDPCGHFGNVVTNARSYADPISINRSLILRARVKSGTNWSEMVSGAFTTDQDFSKLLFTELMYNPVAGTNAGAEFEEFVELKNVGTVALDLAGLELRDVTPGVSLERPPQFLCAPGTVVAPGALFVLARSTNVFRAMYPGAPVHGQLNSTFGNAEGRPALRSTNGAIATWMQYYSHAPWPVVPDNHGYFGSESEVGFSLVRAMLDPNADSLDFGTWRASTHRLGSPGADDPPPLVPPIYINELLSRPGSGLSDTVELFNPNPTNVHVGGWWLSDERNWPFRYQIPPGTMVPAFGFLVLDETDFNTGTNSLSFSSDGERCYLFSGDTNGTLTGYSHGFAFGGSDRDVAFGRNLSRDGSDYLLPEIARTLGETNSGSRSPALMIAEVMYRPDGADVQFIELRNTTGLPLPLWDAQRPTNSYALAGYCNDSEIIPQFWFPTNTTVPADASVLLVPVAPEIFRATHAVPSNALIFQLPDGLGSGLGNQSGVIKVLRPSGTADYGQPRYVIIDQVTYENVWPWDPGAGGDGQSLERIGLTPFGPDPVSWRANPAGSSPGSDSSTNYQPKAWAGGARTAFLNQNALLVGAVLDDSWPGTGMTSWWAQVSGPGTAQLRSNTLVSVQATFPQAGPYVLRFTVSDGVYLTTDDATIDVIAPPFESWRGTNFTPEELNDPLISGPQADPDGDGLTNIEEFFFGTAPKVRDALRPLRAELVNGYLELIWTQRAAAVELSTTLEQAHRVEGPWFGGPGLFDLIESVPSGPGLKRVRMRSVLPCSESRIQFARLLLGP